MKETLYYGLKCGFPPKFNLKFYHHIPQSAVLFGDRAFKEVARIKVKS